MLIYDVCTDTMVELGGESLYKYMTEIIVCLDIPECMEIHEKLFKNNQKIGQWEIQKRFSEFEYNKYTLIDQWIIFCI